jgi:predicted peptidase
MKENVYEGLRYVVRYPENFDRNREYPTLIFLHGAGTIGNDIEKLKNNPFWTHAECVQFPGVIFAPQCDEGLVWYDLFEKLRAFVKMIISCGFVDPSRLYLTGNSMGGYGAWQLAMSLNDAFAAVIPVCGGGMYWNAGRLKNTPVWAFHGAKDRVVFCEESQKMVNAVNAKGGNAKLTVYPENGHDSWTDTYGNREVWEWMLSQRKKAGEVQSEKYDGKQFG